METISWFPSAVKVTPPQAMTSSSGPVGGICDVTNSDGGTGRRKSETFRDAIIQSIPSTGSNATENEAVVDGIGVHPGFAASDALLLRVWQVHQLNHQLEGDFVDR